MLKGPALYRDNHRIMKIHYKVHSIEKTNPSRRSLCAIRIPAPRLQAASSHQIIFSFLPSLSSVWRYSFSLYLQLFSNWVFARNRFLTRSTIVLLSAYVDIVLLPVVGLFFSLQSDTSASRLTGCDCLTFFFYFGISLLGILPPMYRQPLY